MIRLDFSRKIRATAERKLGLKAKLVVFKRVFKVFMVENGPKVRRYALAMHWHALGTSLARLATPLTSAETNPSGIRT